MIGQEYFGASIIGRHIMNKITVITFGIFLFGMNVYLALNSSLDWWTVLGTSSSAFMVGFGWGKK